MTRDAGFYAFELGAGRELSRHASESIFDIDTPHGRVRLKVTSLLVVEIVDDNIGVIDPDCQSCQFCAPTGRLSPRRPKR
ncbi:MAG: hypothetical protein ABSF67_14655 [Roseiarcus sp.]|jgi:hypothetical protein